MKEIKKPTIEGLKKAKEEFDKARNKKPSDDLIDIISEIGEEDEIIKHEVPLEKVARGNEITAEA